MTQNTRWTDIFPDVSNSLFYTFYMYMYMHVQVYLQQMGCFHWTRCQANRLMTRSRNVEKPISWFPGIQPRPSHKELAALGAFLVSRTSWACLLPLRHSWSSQFLTQVPTMENIKPVLTAAIKRSETNICKPQKLLIK